MCVCGFANILEQGVPFYSALNPEAQGHGPEIWIGPIFLSFDL